VIAEPLSEAHELEVRLIQGGLIPVLDGAELVEYSEVHR
jgi:hypothetical protein